MWTPITRMRRPFCRHAQVSLHASVAHFTTDTNCQHTPAYASIRQHTSAHVSIRQHTSAYVNVVPASHPTHPGAWHTAQLLEQASAGCIRQNTSGYVRIRQDTSGYVSFRGSQRDALRIRGASLESGLAFRRMLTYACVQTYADVC